MSEGTGAGALSLSLRLAARGDAQSICDLVNGSYRGLAGEHGWTSEADLVAGRSAEVADIEEAIGRVRSLIPIGVDGPGIIACVRIEKAGADVHIGMFSVQPSWQGRGIGTWLLKKRSAMRGAC